LAETPNNKRYPLHADAAILQLRCYPLTSADKIKRRTTRSACYPSVPSLRRTASSSGYFPSGSNILTRGQCGRVNQSAALHKNSFPTAHQNLFSSNTPVSIIKLHSCSVRTKHVGHGSVGMEADASQEALLSVCFPLTRDGEGCHKRPCLHTYATRL
jgi:hypothetical protein